MASLPQRVTASVFCLPAEERSTEPLDAQEGAGGMREKTQLQMFSE